MTKTNLNLNNAIDALFEDENERFRIKSFLASTFNISNSAEKNVDGTFNNVVLEYLFDNVSKDISVISYDDATSAEAFVRYFSKYQNLKGDLICEIFTTDNAPWIQRVFETKELFFLVSDSQWKYKSVSVSAGINFVLIGKEKHPTIEINIL